jgi:hypothetical protein
MRDILHLVDKEKRENPTFQTLHDLNHEMRDRWHDLKKGRDREANLTKLHDQLLSLHSYRLRHVNQALNRFLTKGVSLVRW